jgi:hypothetical protein
MFAVRLYSLRLFISDQLEVFRPPARSVLHPHCTKAFTPRRGELVICVQYTLYKYLLKVIQQ